MKDLNRLKVVLVEQKKTYKTKDNNFLTCQLNTKMTCFRHRHSQEHLSKFKMVATTFALIASYLI